jgi:uncharacterized protein
MVVDKEIEGMSTMWKVVSLVAIAALVFVVVALVLTHTPAASAAVVGPAPAVAVQRSGSAPVSVGAALDANGSSSTGGINVTGQGQVKAKPDVAYINLGVSSTGTTAKEAMDQNSAAMNSVVAKLAALGIDKKDMRTGNISLSPQTDTSKSGDASAPKIVGYWANNSLVVTVNDVNKVGAVLDAAVTAGANTAGGIRFDIKDSSKLQTEALNAALKDARSQADVVAAGLGLKVTGVQSATVDSTGGSGPIYLGMGAAPRAMAADQAPVEPGEMTISAVVRVTFGF